MWKNSVNFCGTQLSPHWALWYLCISVIQPFASRSFSIFFECKLALIKFEYFGLRLVITLRLHFKSVKFDLSYFSEREKTCQHQGTVNGKYCAFCTQICVTHITVGCECSTLMVWNKLWAFSWSADIRCAVSQVLSCVFQAAGYISNPYFSHLSHFLNEWMKCLYHSQIELLGFFSNKWW